MTANATNAVITGRLLPGGRTPVIVALGLSRFSVRRFVLIDTVACALWAAIYSTIGSIGGRIANHPVWAMVIAIAFAVSMGVLVQELRNHVAKEIGPIAKPRSIMIVSELPKTRSGKIMRRLLRDVADRREVGDPTTLADTAVMSIISAQVK